MDFSRIRLLILDVDGVLTDGRLHMQPDGHVNISFHVRDGLAIQLWQRMSGRIAILSGRQNEAVVSRARELRIESVHMGIREKLTAYKTILAENTCGDESVAYIGDDSPDIPVMQQCAFAVAVADASPLAKRSADYIARRPGGGGAVAEVIELILRKQKRWAEATGGERGGSQRAFALKLINQGAH